MFTSYSLTFNSSELPNIICRRRNCQPVFCLFVCFYKTILLLNIYNDFVRCMLVKIYQKDHDRLNFLYRCIRVQIYQHISNEHEHQHRGSTAIQEEGCENASCSGGYVCHLQLSRTRLVGTQVINYFL